MGGIERTSHGCARGTDGGRGRMHASASVKVTGRPTTLVMRRRTKVTTYDKITVLHRRRVMESMATSASTLSHAQRRAALPAMTPRRLVPANQPYVKVADFAAPRDIFYRNIGITSVAARAGRAASGDGLADEDVTADGHAGTPHRR